MIDALAFCTMANSIAIVALGWRMRRRRRPQQPVHFYHKEIKNGDRTRG